MQASLLLPPFAQRKQPGPVNAADNIGLGRSRRNVQLHELASGCWLLRSFSTSAADHCDMSSEHRDNDGAVAANRDDDDDDCDDDEDDDDDDDAAGNDGVCAEKECLVADYCRRRILRSTVICG